ncbi:MAG TPA: 30S ribosome-binding factor RbfA [Anaerolineales bacterium]|nr:30S ribosome-binding factor RbfA [Anaerolineales bacterium]
MVTSRKPAALRQKRLADQIQQVLGEMLSTELADPRLELVTVTDVQVDREFDYANIWVCALDSSPDHQKEILRGLHSASGYIRKRLAERIDIRKMPRLVFHWDPAPERITRVQEILAHLPPPAES